MISNASFKGIVERYIMPLVAGTKLIGCRRACSDYVVKHPETSIKISISPSKDRHYVVYLSRTQHFSENEVALIRSIARKWARAFRSTKFQDKFLESVAEQCQVEAIAEYIDAASKHLLLRMIGVLHGWSGQTYEGRRISFSLGVDKQAPKDVGVSLWDAVEEDYIKVMTSVHDSLFVCNTKGHIVSHESLFEPDAKSLAAIDGTEQDIYAPTGFIALARWASGGRYAVALNRAGEILLFKDGSLAFARRRGKWILFTHSAYIAGMQRGAQSLNVRKALYQTMLDVSFNRTGGCMGLVRQNRLVHMDSINPADRLDTPDSASLSSKNSFLRSIINGRKFHELPRKLRQELVSMDGATVVKNDGSVLAMGAILKIDGGSAGGGRSAAAMELAKNGIGVKISNDGKVTYWAELYRHKSKEEPLPKYEIG